VAAVALTLLAAGLVSTRADTSTNSLEKPWDSSVALGLTIMRGNSHSEAINATIAGDKVWAADELRLQLDGLYGVTDGTKSAETLHGLIQWNHLFTSRFYSTLLVDGLHDGVADLAYRVILSPNAGYYFIKTDLTKLSTEAGPSFIIKKEDGTPVTEYVAARIAERFDRVLSPSAKLWQTAEYLPRVDDYEDYLLNFELGVDAHITKAFSVRVVLDDRYDSRPALGRRDNDIILVSGIAYKF
jgi:putative salt-induced outer membrane protein YdiY